MIAVHKGITAVSSTEGAEDSTFSSVLKAFFLCSLCNKFAKFAFFFQ